MKLICLFILAILTYTANTQSNSGVFKGIVGRRWFYGGTFKKALGNVQNTTAQNLVSWNGTAWETLGSDFPNGNVGVIQTDVCRNVYIGGSFTSVGANVAGPAARWNAKNKIWENIGNKGDITWGAGAVVHDIAINCRNWVTSLTCPCSVYLVGKFNATLKDGKVATNVVKYEFSDKSWDNLGGSFVTKMGDGEITSAYTKQLGLTGAIYLVWFAGSFTGNFQRHDTRDKSFGFADSTVPAKLNGGTIKSIYYKTETGTTTDKVYIAGDFLKVLAEGGECNRVCYFNYQTEKFYPVGTGTIPNAVVNYVELNGNTVYIGGAFTNSAWKYVAKLGASGWEGVSTNDASIITTPVSVIDVCNQVGSAQVDCRGGSMAVAGGKLSKYYDAASKAWGDFGKGIDGTTSAVQSQFSSAKSLSSRFAFLILIISILLTAF